MNTFDTLKPTEPGVDYFEMVTSVEGARHFIGPEVGQWPGVREFRIRFSRTPPLVWHSRDENFALVNRLSVDSWEPVTATAN